MSKRISTTVSMLIVTALLFALASPLSAAGPAAVSAEPGLTARIAAWWERAVAAWTSERARPSAPEATAKDGPVDGGEPHDRHYLQIEPGG